MSDSDDSTEFDMLISEYLNNDSDYEQTFEEAEQERKARIKGDCVCCHTSTGRNREYMRRMVDGLESCTFMLCARCYVKSRDHELCGPSWEIAIEGLLDVIDRGYQNDMTSRSRYGSQYGPQCGPHPAYGITSTSDYWARKTAQNNARYNSSYASANASANAPQTNQQHNNYQDYMNRKSATGNYVNTFSRLYELRKHANSAESPPAYDEKDEQDTKSSDDEPPPALIDMKESDYQITEPDDFDYNIYGMDEPDTIIQDKWGESYIKHTSRDKYGNVATTFSEYTPPGDYSSFGSSENIHRSMVRTPSPDFNERYYSDDWGPEPPMY
jgi:hypothetical protein